MKTVKVAHVTTVDLSLRYLLLNQLVSLREAGYEVVGLSSPGPHVAYLEEQGIRHIAVPMARHLTPAADMLALARLYRVMRREQFDIVHTHTPKPGLLGQLAARLAGVPVVINTLHGFYFHDGMRPLTRRFYISMEQIAARCSDVILSQNREDIQTAIHERICPPERIKHLGNGIDLRRFDRARLDARAIEARRRELDLPVDAPVVGFVGRLVAEKGLLDLLEATRSIRAAVPRVRFLIVGPVDAERPDALTPAIANRYGAAEICRFTGLRQDMPELYALMDVFVLPSYREGFPRAPMEASAMGIPCVVTDIRGCREAVVHDENGLLVPPGNAPALAKAVVDLLTDRDRAQGMGRRARQLAQARFDERLVFDRVHAEYQRLGDSARAPASASG